MLISKSLSALPRHIRRSSVRIRSRRLVRVATEVGIEVGIVDGARLRVENFVEILIRALGFQVEASTGADVPYTGRCGCTTS